MKEEENWGSDFLLIIETSLDVDESDWTSLDIDESDWTSLDVDELD